MAAVKSTKNDVADDVRPDSADGGFVAELVRHQRRIYAFIGSLVHHQRDIEDLYQQTCLVLWKKHDQFDGSRDFIPLACGIAKHEVFNYPRKRDHRGRAT